MALLLAVEGGALTLRYDSPQVVPGSGWWFESFELLHKLVFPGAIGFVLMLALVLLRPSGVGAHGTRPKVRRTRWVTGLMIHLVTLAIFVGLTNQVYGGDPLALRWPRIWISSWYAAGLAVLLTWLNALDADVWRTLSGRRAAGILSLGGGVTLGGYLLSQFSGQFWTPLAWVTMAAVRMTLEAVGSDVVCDLSRNLIGVRRFSVQIAPSCSGYEGIGLVWAFLAVYVVWSRRSLRWPHAWLLIALGTAAIWLFNVARIAGLILIGASGYPEVAVGGFHSQAGSLGFLVTSLSLVAVSRWSPFFAAHPDEVAAGPASAADPAGLVNPTAAYLIPFLALVATTMLTGAVSAGFDSLYPLRIIAGGLALWFVHRSYAGRLMDWSGWAVLAGFGVFGLWILLEPANPAGARAVESGFARLPRAWAVVWLGFRVVGSVVVVPLVEEWAFRGYLTRRLIASDFESVPLGRFTWFSFLVSSLAFGLLHGRWVAGTVAGLIYAGVYYRRGRVGDAALAHALTNACIAATVLATHDWTYWS